MDFPFAKWWGGADINKRQEQRRVSLGLLGDRAAPGPKSRAGVQWCRRVEGDIACLGCRDVNRLDLGETAETVGKEGKYHVSRGWLSSKYAWRKARWGEMLKHARRKQGLCTSKPMDMGLKWVQLLNQVQTSIKGRHASPVPDQALANMTHWARPWA